MLPHDSSIDFDAIRRDFPRLAERAPWLAAAETHPFSIHHVEALQRYAQFRYLGPGEGRNTFTPEMQLETKQRFARLINANSADEIAFVQSTTDGENIILAGLDLARNGGNVVIDDLHFEASKYIYRMLEESGAIELRIVSHRDWEINFADIERMIDDNTQLVSIALVSQVNGYLADVAAISRVAHAHGAYLYADIIQGAGCTPIDVQAMGIDFAATSTYKWLMGDFGIGFLYVRQELQEQIVKQTRFGLRNVKSMDDFEFETHATAARYEGTSSMPIMPGLCVHEGLQIVEKIGVENIVNHAQPLAARLQQGMATLGYRGITPRENPTPIVSFVLDDKDATAAKLEKAFGEQVISFRKWFYADENGVRHPVDGLRIGISVYNNEADIDRLLNALDGKSGIKR